MQEATFLVLITGGDADKTTTLWIIGLRYVNDFALKLLVCISNTHTLMPSSCKISIRRLASRRHLIHMSSTFSWRNYPYFTTWYSNSIKGIIFSTSSSSTLGIKSTLIISTNYPVYEQNWWKLMGSTLLMRAPYWLLTKTPQFSPPASNWAERRLCFLRIRAPKGYSVTPKEEWTEGSGW